MDGLNYFLPGQVWQYSTRPGEESSTITVLKIDEIEDDAIIHIRIDHIQQLTGGCIQHMPFAADAVLASVTDFVKHLNEVPGFVDGYNQWKQAHDEGKAGYWNMPVKEAVEAVCQVMSKNE
ncbi:MAG TPA: hypothetical protein VHL77_06815 [Ferruginibacter sp.]|jgi:hypothetical protein|nr:hypothetical protein [Ferruginibacter sp.]